jgi:hypothetical protein
MGALYNKVLNDGTSFYVDKQVCARRDAVSRVVALTRLARSVTLWQNEVPNNRT